MSMQPKSLNSVKIYGFGIIKNGVKFDFPFRESVLSFKSLVEKVFYVLGDSADDTNLEFQKFDFCVTENSIWDTTVTNGIVISQETNKALTLLKKSVDCKSAWGIYLQADEVLHQEDYALIRNDLEKAELEGFDAISFRYLHFWKTHHEIAITKGWYPREIRAIKLDSEIVSWGDGQSFKNCKKILNSEARIYHYGHVREANAYSQKMQFQTSFHFQGIRYYRKRFKAQWVHLKEKSINYFGTHPLVMKDRIISMKGTWELPEEDRVYILGDKNNYSEKLILAIKAKEIYWIKTLSEAPREFQSKVVITNPTGLDFYFKRTKVKSKMESPLAEDWSLDFRLILQLSEKKIGLKNIL